jgi:Zn-dependent peptidase ImmA (M78 family)
MSNEFSSASELLTYLKNTKNFEVKAPVDVDEIAAKLDIKVEEDFSLEIRDIVGEIFIKEGNTTVRINPIKNSYAPRRRFTLAHEIGHFCLHSSKLTTGFIDSVKTMSRTESYWDSRESEANNFAAQLLMPKSLIINEGQQYIDSYKKITGKQGISSDLFIEAMADKFEVSSKAMEYRLKNIGILK